MSVFVGVLTFTRVYLCVYVLLDVILSTILTVLFYNFSPVSHIPSPVTISSKRYLQTSWVVRLTQWILPGFLSEVITSFFTRSLSPLYLSVCYSQKELNCFFRLSSIYISTAIDGLFPFLIHTGKRV